MPTYIHNGTEVNLTGRTASKKRKRTRPGKTDITLYEVKPLDDRMDWAEWVEMDELFLVEEPDVQS